MAQYIGQCDRLRRTKAGEELWQEIMSSAFRISEKLFLEHANVDDVLDDDETWTDYKNSVSDEVNYFCSNARGRDVVFFRTCGFEFMWYCF